MGNVNLSVAPNTKSDQVFLNVTTERASILDMVHLKVARTATPLASPSIALEHLAAELLVGSEIQPNPSAHGTFGVHDAFGKRSMNSAFCGCGRRTKSRLNARSKESGFPASRFAPARKSAQIISRQ